MSTLTEAAPTATGSADDDITHLVCCDDNVARCGEDVSAHDWRNDRPDDECCPLCLAMRDAYVDSGRCCQVGEVTW